MTLEHSPNVGGETLADVQRDYAKTKDETRSEWASIVDMIREYRVDKPIKNTTYEHALQLTDQMLLNTKHHYRMVTGGYGDHFIETLCESFHAMLRRLRANNGKAQIIIANTKDRPRCLSVLAEEFSDVLEIAYVRANKGSLSHFIVCDDDMVRDENPHDPFTSEDKAERVHADVYFSSKARAGTFTTIFDSIWDVTRGLVSGR